MFDPLEQAVVDQRENVDLAYQTARDTTQALVTGAATDAATIADLRQQLADTVQAFADYKAAVQAQYAALGEVV